MVPTSTSNLTANINKTANNDNNIGRHKCNNNGVQNQGIRDVNKTMQ